MSRRARVLAAVCAVAVVVVGCGSSSSSDFRKKYNQVTRANASLPTDVNTAVTTASGKSDADLARRFSSLSDRTNRYVDQLQQLKPPSKAKDEYNAFLGSLRKIANDVSAISSAATSHDARKARASVQSLGTDAKSSGSAEDALKKAVD